MDTQDARRLLQLGRINGEFFAAGCATAAFPARDQLGLAAVHGLVLAALAPV